MQKGLNSSIRGTFSIGVGDIYIEQSPSDDESQSTKITCNTVMVEIAMYCCSRYPMNYFPLLELNPMCININHFLS